MTISPPAKVKLELLTEPIILTSGVDSLNLSLNVKWENSYFQQTLEAYKKIAQIKKHPHQFFFDIPEENEQFVFDVYPHGANGYNWIISNSNYAIKFSKGLFPKPRPNVFIEIRSETLWGYGVNKSVSLITLFLKEVHAKIITIKPSRIDLCMDFLAPKAMWDLSLFKNKVTRARRFAHYTVNDTLTGVHIGKGKMSGRIYDKGEEIESQSHKEWMYDVWDIESIPEKQKAIRVEFQLLREPLKELGIDTLQDCIAALDNIWAYCTQKWLKFQTNPGKHHTQRKTLSWWRLIQDNYLGVPKPVPAIRVKAVRTTQLQLASQIVGLATSLASVDDEFGISPLVGEASYEGLVKVFRKALSMMKKSNLDIKDAVNRKRAKNHRGKIKYQVAQYDRLAAGLPADMLTLGIEDDLTWELYDMGETE